MIDTSSSTWLTIKEWCEVEIERSLKQIEVDCPESYLQQHRGAIKAFRALLKLGEQKPDIDIQMRGF